MCQTLDLHSTNSPHHYKKGKAWGAAVDLSGGQVLPRVGCGSVSTARRFIIQNMDQTMDPHSTNRPAHPSQHQRRHVRSTESGWSGGRGCRGASPEMMYWNQRSGKLVTVEGHGVAPVDIDVFSYRRARPDRFGFRPGGWPLIIAGPSRLKPLLSM